MSSVNKQIDEQEVRRFLLGELPDSQQVELERRFFEDDNAYKQILAIQEELADDYVRDHLPASERNLFVQNFLRSSLRRERLEYAAVFARALETPGDNSIEAPARASWIEGLSSFFRPSFQFALVSSALAVVLLAGLGWLVFQNRRLSQRVEQVSQQNQSLIKQAGSSQQETSAKQAELQKEVAAQRAQASSLQATLDEKQRELDKLKADQGRDRGPAGGALASFVLSAGISRGEDDEPEKLIIPATARSVQLHLNLERVEKYREFIAEVRTARGNLVWSRRGLESSGENFGAVVVTVPAALLSNGEYEISLKGTSPGSTEAIGYYYIIALRR
jgi:hypothetical protein